MEERIKELNEDLIPLRFRIMQSEIDEKICAIAIQKLEHLYSLCPSSGEYHKILSWIETLCKIPFNRYKALPVQRGSDQDMIKSFIQEMRASMDENVYGHVKAKEHIIRLLAQWISNPSSKGLVIGIQGSMGTGKTTLIKQAICETLNLPFAFVPLGGASDASYLVGHSYTFEGSKWGKIVDVLMQCKCMNPVLFFDELDKVSTGRHGEEIINILIHLTDASQNEHFHDKYFDGLNFDLSRSLIIFSYNHEENINPILRDRMVCIRTDGYSAKDKVAIAQSHVIPTLHSEFGFPQKSLIFTDDVLLTIISKVEEEEGIRNFRRALHDIFSNVNFQNLTSENTVFPVTVSDKDVKKFVSSSDKKNTLKHFSMYS